MSDYLNTRMMAHPLNWAILFFMAFSGAVLVDLAFRIIEMSHEIHNAQITLKKPN